MTAADPDARFVGPAREHQSAMRLDGASILPENPHDARFKCSPELDPLFADALPSLPNDLEDRQFMLRRHLQKLNPVAFLKRYLDELSSN